MLQSPAGSSIRENPLISWTGLINSKISEIICRMNQTLHLRSTPVHSHTASVVARRAVLHFACPLNLMIEVTFTVPRWGSTSSDVVLKPFHLEIFCSDFKRPKTASAQNLLNHCPLLLLNVTACFVRSLPATACSALQS